MKRFLVLLSLALTGIAAGLPAQTPKSTPTPTPGFEVANVKMSPPGGDGMTVFGDMKQPRFRIKNATMMLLLEIAYHVSEADVVGAPRWIEETRYDVETKVEGEHAPADEQFMAMFQGLLAERFHLQVHRQTVMKKGYALVTAKGGPKLTPSKGTGDGPAYLMPNKLHCVNVGTSVVAQMLARLVHQPMMDATGIKGSFDIDLNFASENTPTEGAADSPAPSVFTAVQEQLGLRLEPRMVPVELLVLDHVDKEPAPD